jgi:hypothetical protein
MLRRSIFMMFVLSLLGTGIYAQAERETFDLAIETLQNAESYSFSYSLIPSVDATSPISGQGEADLANHAWRYTVSSDPDDPNADRSRDGEWIVVGGLPYRRTNGEWEMGMDFTHAGITSMVGAFANYATFEMMAEADPDAGLEEVALIGTEVIEGEEAEHYRFATEGMPLYGTATYDAWISMADGRVSRVVLAITAEDGQVNRVAFHGIDEPVTIEAP